MVAAASVVAEDAPILEPCDGVLDSRSTSTVDSPASVADDAAIAKQGRAQLGDASVSTVCENSAVGLAQGLE